MEEIKTLIEYVDFLKSIENSLIENRPLIEELAALYQKIGKINRLTCTPIEAAEYEKIRKAIDAQFAEITPYGDILDKSKHFHLSEISIDYEIKRFYETATEEQTNSLKDEILNSIDKYRDFKKHTMGLLYISLPCDLEKVLEYLYNLYDKTGLGWLEERPRLIIPDSALNWLQETRCRNGKTYIEDATAKPLKWLQNKQLARDLLTHPKIKGSLTNAYIERLLKSIPIFIYRKGKQLTLSKPKTTTYTGDHDRLMKFLATLPNC